MGWSKRDFIVKAFGEIGLASYIFNLQPNQYQDAANRLDAMMGSWNARGIRVGYPISSTPTDYDLDEQTNVQDAAYEAIYTNLALKIAPGFGKVVSPETKINAKTSLDALESFLSMPQPMQLSIIPRGAGNRAMQNYRPFIQPVREEVTTGLDGPLDLSYDPTQDITTSPEDEDVSYTITPA